MTAAERVATSAPAQDALPPRWERVRLGEVLTQYTQFIETPDTREYPKLSVKLYGKGVVLDTPADGASLRMKRHQLARSGQVILSEIWGKKGAIGLVPPEGEGALCTSHFFLFDIRQDRIDQRWLQALFSANYLQDQLDSAARGTTGYAAVRPKHLLSAEIPLPPLGEQRHMVARIEALATRIAEAQRLRREAEVERDSLWQSVLSNALSGWDRTDVQSGDHAALLLRRQAEKVANAERTSFNGAHPWAPNIYEDGLTDLPEGWVWTDLGSVLTHLVDCVNDTPDFASEATGILGLKSTNIRPHRLDLTQRWFVTESDFMRWTRRLEPRPRDLVLTREAPMGNACMLPEGVRTCLTQRLMLLRSDQEFVCSEFLLYFLNSPMFQAQIKELCRGLTTPHIRVQDAPTLRIPLPPRIAQTAIVTYLDEMHTRLARFCELQLETSRELDALLPSVLDRAFRGEL